MAHGVGSFGKQRHDARAHCPDRLLPHHSNMALELTPLRPTGLFSLHFMVGLWSSALGCDSVETVTNGSTDPAANTGGTSFNAQSTEGAGGDSNKDTTSKTQGGASNKSSAITATGGGSSSTKSASSKAQGGASSSKSSGASTQPCTPPATGARIHDAGNYDNRSCNAPECHHGDQIGGGWVYASPKGPPWVGGATITIKNNDGTTVTAISADDGFFTLSSKVTSPYEVCVSKCPGTDCNTTPHLDADCQTSNCHGNSSQRIYVSQNAGGAPSTGGASSVGGGSCVPAAPGGPYTHVERVFGNQPCSEVGCHSDPKPVFKGGYVYDGVTSSKTVAEATVTLTPKSGKAVTAVTGPDGMFFFGTIGSTSTAIEFAAPYTACVSKCPLTVCSAKNSHTTTEDCQTSNCHNSELKIYLE